MTQERQRVREVLIQEKTYISYKRPQKSIHIVCKNQKTLTIVMSMKKQVNIKLFFALSLTMTGFLVCITAFSISYKILSLKKYPEAWNILPQNTVKKVSFIAVGDIMLSRNVAHHAEK